MTTIVIITKVLNVHDPMIGMMGALSWVTSFMVWALATQGWMMYLATGLSSIGKSFLDILGKRSGSPQSPVLELYHPAILDGGQFLI